MTVGPIRGERRVLAARFGKIKSAAGSLRQIETGTQQTFHSCFKKPPLRLLPVSRRFFLKVSKFAI